MQSDRTHTEALDIAVRSIVHVLETVHPNCFAGMREYLQQEIHRAETTIALHGGYRVSQETARIALKLLTPPSEEIGRSE